jgi:hypothetical protein
MPMINRRSFPVGSAGAITAPAAIAQQRRTRRIVLLDSTEPSTAWDSAGWRAFISELRRLGYREGGDIVIDRISGRTTAVEVMSYHPEVIAATVSAASEIWDSIDGTPIVLVGWDLREPDRSRLCTG